LFSRHSKIVKITMTKENTSKLTKANLKNKSLKQVLSLETGRNFGASVEALGNASKKLAEELSSYSTENKEYLTLSQEAVEFSQLFRLLTLMNETIQAVDKNRKATLETMQRPSSKSKLEKAKLINLSVEEIKLLLQDLEKETEGGV
jgi:hypothetical protein